MAAEPSSYSADACGRHNCTQDRVNRACRPALRLSDPVQKTDEFLVAMARHALARHYAAVEDIERCESAWSHPVADVIVGHCSRPGPSSSAGRAGYGRAPGSGSSRRPTAYQAMRRRVEIEPDHVAQLGGKSRVLRQLKWRTRCGCSTVRRPDCAAPSATRCRSPRPSPGRSSGLPPPAAQRGSVRRPGRSGLRARAADQVCASCRATARPRPRASNRSCQRHTHGFEIPARRIIAAVPQPSAVAQDDLRPPHMFLPAIAIRHDRGQSLTVGGTHFDADPLAHPASLHRSRQYGIRMIASYH